MRIKNFIFNVFFALIFLCVFFSISAFAALEPSPARECAICHFRWLNPFVLQIGTPFWPRIEFEDVAGSELICLSCHDGSVADSRDKVWVKLRHFVDKKPPENFQIPAIFPLQPETGNLICSTCHTAHGVPTDKGRDFPFFMRIKNIDSVMCEMCHIDKPIQETNHPMHMGNRDLPKAIFKAGAVRSSENPQFVICQSCHTPHGGVEKNLLLKASTSELCIACHPDRESHLNSPLSGEVNHPIGMKFDPPWKAGEGFFLGADNTVQCISCHKIHGHAQGTKALVQPKNKLCPTCHVNKKSLINTDHDMRVVGPSSENYLGDKVDKSGVCGVCHVPHNAKGPFLWARPVNQDKPMSASDLCLSCHSEGNAGEKKMLGTFTHPVGSKLPFSPNSMPLFASVAEGGIQTFVECPSCHEPHQWDPSNSSPGVGVNLEGDSSNSFLRMSAMGDSALCFDCHTDKITLRKTDHDMAVAAPVSVNDSGQTVDVSGPCGVCHTPHNASGEFLWARWKNEGFPSTSEMCLNCHSEGGAGEKKTLGKHTHPVGRVLQPNPLSLPTFLTDTEAGPQAMVECPSCHEPHQWNPNDRSEGSAENIEGDASNSFLRISAFGDSKLCEDCHSNKFLVRGSDHDMAVTAADSKNGYGQTVDVSGPCGACHTPHNATGQFLWVRWEGDGEPSPSDLCLTCHMTGMAGKEKTLGEFTHPVGRVLEPSPKSLPVFGVVDELEKPARVECPSCHEPHQWNPVEYIEGPGKNIEGDASNSFLRKPSGADPALCSDCHETKYYLEGTDHDMNVAGPNAVNNSSQNVSESGLCGVCHTPHNASGQFLWARWKGSDSPTPSDLCLTCHTEGNVGEKKTVGEHSHPVGRTMFNPPVSLPLFEMRDGDFVEETVECPSCHEPHQWSFYYAEKGPGKNIEGTAADSFLRRPNESMPLLCMECHYSKSLVNATDHDMRVTSPGFKNVKGEDPSVGGVCVSCHSVHNAPEGVILWASKLADAGKYPAFMERTCRGCHEEGGAGAARVVGVGDHPQDLYIGMTKDYVQFMMQSPEARGRLLLFNEEGRETLKGGIYCPTCHDPHIWKSDAESMGTGLNPEGDMLTSFLRKYMISSLCSNCHKEWALTLFPFYHEIDYRVKFRDREKKSAYAPEE